MGQRFCESSPYVDEWGYQRTVFRVRYVEGFRNLDVQFDQRLQKNAEYKSENQESRVVHLYRERLL